MPENKSQIGQIEIDRSEDKYVRDGQVELRNEMNCDQGGGQKGRSVRVFGTGVVWVWVLKR